MTADKYLTYWCSNDNWWEYSKNGKPTILPTVPEEAQKSYRYYLDRIENELDLQAYEKAMAEYKASPVTHSLEDVINELEST